MVTTTAIYARLSTADAGDSIASQVDTCRRWLELQGADPSDALIYSEDAQSAFSKSMTARPQWARLEADIRRGKITRVVSRHMDRITRSVADLLHLTELVKATGVRLDTVWSGDLDLNSATGQQIATITAAISQGESATKSERVRASKARARAQGRASGGRTPFGWQSVNGDLQDDEAQLIRSAIHYVIDGGTLLGAARMFTGSGLLPHNGKQWRPTSVRYVLCRWRNAGHLSHQGEDAGPATFPAIVSLDELHAVRGILMNSSRRRNRNPARVMAGPYPTTLLSGLATCGKCGSTFKGGGHANNSGLAVYRCRSCNSAVSRDLLDGMAAMAMVRFWSRVDVADVAPTDDLRAEIQALRARMAQLEQERSETMQLRKDGLVSVSELRDLMRAITERQEALDNEMRDMQERFALASTLHLGTDVLSDSAALLRRWNSTPLDLQRSQLAEVWEITVRPVDAVKAQTVMVNGREYREHVTKARSVQRRALFTCRLAPHLSFDPVEQDRDALMATIAEGLDN